MVIKKSIYIMSKNNEAQELANLQRKLAETVSECAEKIAENKALVAENVALKNERDGIGRSFRQIIQYAVTVATNVEKTSFLYATLLSVLRTESLRKEGTKSSNIGERITEKSCFGDTIQKIKIQ